MKIDNYNEIKRFFDENLAGRDVLVMVGGYINPNMEYTGEFKGLKYERFGEEIKEVDENFNGEIRLKIGNIEVNLKAGYRRESDKLDLISFEHEKQTVYYLANENYRENGGGIFFKKIE